MADWIENARVRPKRSVYDENGAVRLDEPVGDEFDEVLEPLDELLTGKNKSLSRSRTGLTPDGDPIQDARERQHIERELVRFQNNLRAVVGDMLAPQRIVVEGVIHDKNYDFTLFAVNRSSGRRLNVALSMDEALGLTEHHDRDSFIHLCGKVVTKLLEARDAATL